MAQFPQFIAYVTYFGQFMWNFVAATVFQFTALLYLLSTQLELKHDFIFSNPNTML